MRKIRFTYKPPASGRIHYLTEEDVMVLLQRLPETLWSQLRAVYFNDEARGNRCLGYVTRGRRDIAICALPRNISLGRTCMDRGPSAREFGALPRGPWPERAVRRYMLYNTFLHELGHLQVVDPSAKEVRRRFASETKAQTFADKWRKQLWSVPFEHADPVHNPPSSEELDLVEFESVFPPEPKPVPLVHF